MEGTSVDLTDWSQDMYELLFDVPTGVLDPMARDSNQINNPV